MRESQPTLQYSSCHRLEHLSSLSPWSPQISCQTIAENIVPHNSDGVLGWFFAESKLCLPTWAGLHRKVVVGRNLWRSSGPSSGLPGLPRLSYPGLCPGGSFWVSTRMEISLGNWPLSAFGLQQMWDQETDTHNLLRDKQPNWLLPHSSFQYQTQFY